jgi:hypothetical protein
VSSYDAVLSHLSSETVAALARQEQLENAQTRQEWRERAAAIEAKRQDLAAMVTLGLRTVRSPDQILGDYAAEREVDANASRCRAVFEQWLQRGGQATELKQLLGHQAALDRERMGHQRTELLRRAAEAEARVDARDRRIMELEREVVSLRSQQDRLVGGMAERDQDQARTNRALAHLGLRAAGASDALIGRWRQGLVD